MNLKSVKNGMEFCGGFIMNCPDKDLIFAYTQGTLKDSHKIEQIRSHIESCRKCQKLVRTSLMIDKERHETHSERHEKHEPHQAMDEYDSDLGQRFTSRQAKTLKIIGIIVTVVIMLSIFSLFLWQTHYKKSPSNIISINGVDYRVWKAKDSANDRNSSIFSNTNLDDIDSHLIFLSPKISKLLSHPKMNDEFWQNLAKLLKDQDIQLSENPKVLLIERTLFADIKSGLGSIGGDLSLYIFENGVVMIQWARY